MRILLVEDDDKIADFVQKGLKQAGFAVDWVVRGEEADVLMQHTLTGGDPPYDVGIVDIMLPGMDGLTLIEKLRREGFSLPVLILSAKSSVDERIEGLQKGGDDYLTKPFSFSELLARVQALIRRSSMGVKTNSLSFSDLSIDLLSRKVSRGTEEIELQPKEFALLEYFLRNPETVLSKTMILEHIWDYSFDPQTNVVDVLVHRLRTKVDKGFEKELIHTIRGVGYVLKKT
jgi:two-component system OmpR family response regulator